MLGEGSVVHHLTSKFFIIILSQCAAEPAHHFSSMVLKIILSKCIAIRGFFQSTPSLAENHKLKYILFEMNFLDQFDEKVSKDTCYEVTPDVDPAPDCMM